MMFWRKRRKRLRELDQRVADAEHEKNVSEARLEAVREDVVRPLHHYGERNQFAEMIRRSLTTHSGGQ